MGVMKTSLDVPFEMMSSTATTISPTASPRSVLYGHHGECNLEEITTTSTSTYSTTGREKRRLVEKLPTISLNLRDRRMDQETIEWLARESYCLCIEELWLGPVFQSPEALFATIQTLPESVSHLDLDLRNELNLLPKVLPILFAKTHIETLGLRLFGDAAAMEVAKWISLNPNLKRLDLRGNRIGSSGAKALVDAILESNHPLEYLNLSCNCILDGGDIFSELLQSSTSRIQGLDLSFNWIGNEDVQGICRGLQYNKQLQDLNLFGCQRISEEGIQDILECLKLHNTSLRFIRYQTFNQTTSNLGDQIEILLRQNRAGRCLLRQDSNVYVPQGIWSVVLEKSNRDPSALFYLLREGGIHS